MVRFMVFPILLLLPSCSFIRTPPREVSHPPFAQADSQLTPMLVFSHGHHTGIALPAQAMQDELPALSQSLPGRWLEFGWGDEGFYRTEKISIPLAIRALAYPTPSVMHVHTTNQPLHITYAYAPARLYLLDESQRIALSSYISSHFQRDADGQIIDLGPGRYGMSRFYRARDRFYYPRTCNSWTAKGLRAIGHEVHAITAPGLWRQVRPASLEARNSLP